MRFIFMRHGESMNNVTMDLCEGDPVLYAQHRQAEPEISPTGIERSFKMGETLKGMDIKIERILCSAQKRAIMSAKYFRDGYAQEGEKPEVQLYLKGHEKGACHQGGKTFPGLNRTQICGIIPDIVMKGDNVVADNEGWYKSQTIETHEECILRVKDVVRDLKEMHKVSASPDQTVLVITHGGFVRYLMCILTGQHGLLPEARFHAMNNSITIVDTETKRNIPAKTEYVEARLVSYNVQLIEDTITKVVPISQRLKAISEAVMDAAKSHLQECLDKAGVPDSHGMGHCKQVLAHLMKALEPQNSAFALTAERQLSLMLGALLHDADDHKYFAKDSQNGKIIIQQALAAADPQHLLSDHATVLSDALMMIDHVSASQNGNRVPEIAKRFPEVLWVRFSDRLEAIGVIGAIRCYQYAVEKGNALHVEGQTPRPQTEEEMWKLVLPERFESYQKDGKSASMMDHYYDKLLQIAFFDEEVVQNKYLLEEAKARVAPLVHIALEYGRTGIPPEQTIKDYINKS